MTSSDSISIISVPADTGSMIRGKHLAPAALLDAGLAPKLQNAGFEVSLTNALRGGPAVWRSSSTEPNGARNEAVNVEVYNQVKETVSASLNSKTTNDEMPFQLILGGGCDISPAILSSYWHHVPDGQRIGLIYIDADTDLLKPRQGGSGSLASMTMVHLTMENGALESMKPFTRPDGSGVVDSSNAVLFGINIDAAGNTKEHLGYLLDEDYQVFTSAAVAKEPVRRAQQALKWLEERVDHIIVHLDVDSIDAGMFPLANVPNFTGAGFEQIMTAMKVFVGSQRTKGLVIAEVNPDHDPGAKMTERLVDEVVRYLAARRK